MRSHLLKRTSSHMKQRPTKIIVSHSRIKYTSMHLIFVKSNLSRKKAKGIKKTVATDCRYRTMMTWPRPPFMAFLSSMLTTDKLSSTLTIAHTSFHIFQPLKNDVTSTTIYSASPHFLFNVLFWNFNSLNFVTTHCRHVTEYCILT